MVHSGGVIMKDSANITHCYADFLHGCNTPLNLQTGSAAAGTRGLCEAFRALSDVQGELGASEQNSQNCFIIENPEMTEVL